jgi:cobalt transporter subunit CbtA
MKDFRRLIFVALTSGALAGIFWFTLQYFTIVPLIAAAETYEAAHHDHQAEGAPSQWQRTSLTAIATVLTSVGYASILFGFTSLLARRMDARRGALWGLSAFVCFGLAPALGLPPQPPGVAVADLVDRQIWWTATALATAAGLYLIFGVSRSWTLKLCGILCLALPHIIGAPVAAGESLVPAALIRQFITASLIAAGLFWLTLGLIGGTIYNRHLR